MTDSEIIKALECCSGKYPCRYCPYDKIGCAFEKDALDLINRQKAEILELQKRIINWRADMDYRPEQIKTEAIKKFARKLKCSLTEYPDCYFKEPVTSTQIDDLVKEMTEIKERF